MAAGLAAAIKKKFGLQAELVAGHDGIYEIGVNGRLVYSNRACNHPPLEAEVLAEIAKYSPPLAGPEPGDDPADGVDAPFCAWSPPIQSA